MSFILRTLLWRINDDDDDDNKWKISKETDKPMGYLM